MASNTKICDICFLNHISKTSEHWCPECEKAMCEECKERHQLLKATQGHAPIPISNYMSFLSFITNIQQSCGRHNEQYQQYCVDHALPICIKCIKDHDKCKVITLENATTNVKTSEQFLDLESRLNDLVYNVDRIKMDRQVNVTNIDEMKTRHVKDVERIRVHIIEHLGNREEQMIKDLEEKAFQSKESIQQVLSSVKEKETVINQCQDNFQSIKQYASDLHIFLGINEIEVKVYENEKYLQSLIEKKCVDQLVLECKVDTGVQSILESLMNCGSAEIKSRSSNIRLYRTQDKQAQLQVTAASNTIYDVKINLHKKIETQGQLVRGCCMLREGDFLFTEHMRYRRLTILTSEGTKREQVSLNLSDGYDIAIIDENHMHVAITSGHSLSKTGIDIINIKNKRNEKFIRLPGFSYGITRDRDSMLVCVEKCGIFSMNINDHTTSEVIKRDLPKNSYVSVFADKIYYTNENDYSVVCCDRKGSCVWTFKDDLVLKLPRGITVDNDGNVFVIGEKSSNLMILSHDGKYHKEILTEKDGLNHPTSIDFDKQNSKLSVANKNEFAYIYNIT